ncbi:threonine aldolase family protein [Bacteroidota bacterium]
MIIDLRSDTLTKPTKGMLDAMFNASVGDDVWEEDPSLMALEEKSANIFGKEAGLFCPSGIMTNQLAIKVHVKPGDEVICSRLAHIYNFEGGGIALNSGASVRLLEGDTGKFTAKQVEENINPDNVHYPVTTLVSIEDTCNKGGGAYWDIEEIKKIRDICKNNNIAYHLDGARVFNAFTETKADPVEYATNFDSISICLSKGLGAPVGSVLVGNGDFIKTARRFRRAFGGGMRQGGYLAAAGIYALENNIDRLKEDHRRAKEIANVLRELPYVEELLPVDTNILVFKLAGEQTSEEYLEKLLKYDIKAVSFGPQIVRMVTHLDFTEEMLEEVKAKLPGIQ